MTMSVMEMSEIDPAIDIKMVCRLLGVSRSFVYDRLLNDPGFPKPKRVSSRANRWKQSQILEYRDSLPEYCSQRDEAKAARQKHR
ncbi:helix-turn-helix transcriptional regulator [Burkholderia pseudomallei]|uniref:helix-turn-helix transcriptional regulator n=1 Tax=Burkholderia pseudomallei TaxID=28450 RepID=UPI000F161CB6|nr:AlpA family phage regulatory protein [Burkholderia pseudomallei]VBT28173.1 Predicted transcriptional regulator [Burkholderia pseudomallei]